MAYNILSYGEMIRDRVRMHAYAEALRCAVRPGATVLDIGTGAGILALLACRFGARQVYAVEVNDVVHVAREIAAANGYADRIHFIQGVSTEITLPEQADIIVSDLRGVLPLFQQHLPAIIDARQRLLAPGGILIPQCDMLWAAVVDSPEAYRQVTSPWEDSEYGFDMSAARTLMTHSWRKAPVTPDDFLAEPTLWATLDYTRLSAADVSAELNWTITRPGTGHGLSVWFETRLLADIGFSAAPGQASTIYGQGFFPWCKPVSLGAGDHVSVKLWARLTGNDYAWHWETRIGAAEQLTRPKAQFMQSTVLSSFLSPGQLEGFFQASRS